jgi:hypothetical protein
MNFLASQRAPGRSRRRASTFTAFCVAGLVATAPPSPVGTSRRLSIAEIS